MYLTENVSPTLKGYAARREPSALLIMRKWTGEQKRTRKERRRKQHKRIFLFNTHSPFEKSTKGGLRSGRPPENGSQPIS